VYYFSSIDSTNNAALTLTAQGDREGAIVMAAEQTAGRGRRGRAWFSPPGSGWYTTVVLAPARARVDPPRATLLQTLAAGVALVDGVERATGLRVDLKWPNDLVVARRKLAGILAEVGSGDQIALGYGINLGPAVYPPELAGRATSLETELGRPVDRALVCTETLAALAERYRDLLDGRFDAILDGWRARAPGASGAKVTWQEAGRARIGTTAGIDDRGALLVRTDSGMERLVAGEVTWT